MVQFSPYEGSEYVIKFLEVMFAAEDDTEFGYFSNVVLEYTDAIEKQNTLCCVMSRTLGSW